MYNSIFETLSENPSRNFKIDFLSNLSNDNVLRKIVFLALDPFTQFYIRKIPKYTPAKPNQADSLDSVLDSLSMLSSRQVTGNAGIDYLTKLLSSLVEDDAKVIERIIKKDLACGVSVATVNSVWKNLIPEFPVMLCSVFEQKLVDKISFPAIVQRKEDGMRVNAIVRNNTCEFRSRNGKQIELLGELEQEFIALANGSDVVFDGELLVVKEGKILDRQLGNGILNKANKGTIKLEEAKMVNATIWDMIPYESFTQEICKTPYSSRFDDLSNRISNSVSEKISLVETHFVDSYSEAKIIFERYLEDGFEGIILKDSNGIWENKRAKHQIKFKAELDCDLKIVGVQEGTGKYEGLLGAIICESSDGLLKVSVGSGFTDEQRKELSKENLLDKIVTIKYNNKISNKDGSNSLFLPIFIEIREDKDIADTFEKIK